MRLERANAQVLLAVLSAAVLALAACAPADEPAAEPAAPEPAADEASEAHEDEPQDADAHEDDAVPVAEDADEAPAEDLEITAYVVAYHWGFAIFDEDGSELEQLRAPKGATVELVAVNDHASMAIAQLPELVAEAIQAADWHERAHHDVEAGRIPDPVERAGTPVSTVLDEAHAHGHDLDHHGLMVTGVGARAFLDSHAHEPEHLVFTVDREGTFEFRCTEECGFGHDYQRWEMLVVEA